MAARTPGGAQVSGRKIAVLVAALLAALVLWDQPVVWPLKLLVVMMHESGHALASLVAGGSVDRVVIAGDESGQCLSRLPPTFFAQVLVYSAGYVGSAVVGALLMLFTLRFRLRRSILVAAAVWLGVMGVVYAGDLFTLAFCLGTGVILGACAKWLPDGAVDVLNLFIAAFSALYAVFDLRDDLWSSAVRGQSDAALLADLTYIPAVLWALIWSVFSLGLLGLAAWNAVLHERRARARTTVSARR